MYYNIFIFIFAESAPDSFHHWSS